jgi:hypothetical protein
VFFEKFVFRREDNVLEPAASRISELGLPVRFEGDVGSLEVGRKSDPVAGKIFDKTTKA